MKILIQNRIMSNVLFLLDDGTRVWYTDMPAGSEVREQADQLLKDSIYCVVCEGWIKRSELTRWTGDDQLHYLCPGCGSDLLPVQDLE